MRFLIISDIHSNLEALAAVFSELHNQNEHIDHVLTLGDIVGYGVNPNECCTIIKFLKSGKPALKKEIEKIIQSIDIAASEKENITKYIFSLGKKATVIAGNHDQRVIGLLNTVMASSAGISINWTKKIIHDDNIRFLKSLSLIEKLSKFKIELVHSTSKCPQDYVYVMNSILLNYSVLYSKITFAGHTHKPAAYLYTKHKSDVHASVFIPADQFDKKLMLAERGSADRLETFDVSLNPGQRYYINPGSVGQPRDGFPMASYKIYDTETKKVYMEKAEYDIEGVRKKILDAGLPFDLANRIVSGI
ncbi:diadenosine tetraphosphatase and related serine /threonine protein phosphatases [Candidatus Scalindua japonica]|uniref:Diadenosine tetraphosphatase and related serine /threonine protein phosphatases n=1 Tax=Candidatus Scalindua japonica TaxID=1284222 RepID=A0A286TTU8_9BACT|nr:metallophosphoesterase family protein [Candidatus Scalindua japonica]GAX59283.1 diadenosine tetraphosphatase and related serine /threonine protein phosphatases [Candidatus Scalindua japonica]